MKRFFVVQRLEITPILSIDKYKVGNGKTGEVTIKLHEYYLEVARGKNKN